MTTINQLISNKCRDLYNSVFGKKQVRIIMLGLDGAGKTVILYKLKLNEFVTTIPTIHFNVEAIEYKAVSFTIWDPTGRSCMRGIWKHYFQGSQGIIYVIDSNDRDTIDESREELQRLLNEEELKGLPLLVLANKQDLPKVMDTNAITQKLGMNLLEQRKWHVQPTSGVSKEGLYKGLEWLYSHFC